MKRWKMLTGLLRDFMKFGLFTFGGGWSIVAQMQKRYVEQQGLLTQEELLDLTRHHDRQRGHAVWLPDGRIFGWFGLCGGYGDASYGGADGHYLVLFRSAP